MSHEIPNAFLIRALARRESPYCEGCGSRMFVPTRTGKCPHCHAGYPPRVVHRGCGDPAHLPFAPRLGERVVVDGWVSRSLSGLLAWRSRRARRASGSQTLALRAGESTAHPHPTAG
jgi:hypothetical protein